MTPTDRFLRASLVLAALLASAALWWPVPAQAARIKEVASVQGVRMNQLVGYGLVVGLDGTGDQNTQAPFATQSLLAMLQQMGVTVPPGQNMQLKNLATVMVTAQLPAFAQPGQTIDVNVSSLANAKSLRGGTLIATPLKGADGQIYAMAQGNLIVGGVGASAAGSKVQINHLSAGRIPRRRHRRARRRHADEPGRLDPARPEQQRLRDRPRGGPRDQRPHGPGHRRRDRRPGDPGPHARVGRRPGELPRRDPEPRRPAAAAGGQGRDQRPHRLGGDEPGGDARRLRGGARQPLGHDQHHAGRSASRGRSRAPARPRSPRRPTSRSPSRPARWCRWRRAPSSPTSSRP